MLLKLASNTFVPAVPGSPYQPYSKSCPPTATTPPPTGTILPSTLMTLTAWTVGAEVSGTPGVAGAVLVLTVAGVTYAYDPSQGPTVDATMAAQQNGISNAGVFGALLKVSPVDGSPLGTVYKADGVTPDLERSAGLLVYQVGSHLFNAAPVTPKNWFTTRETTVKQGDSIFLYCGAGALWSQVLNTSGQAILNDVIATQVLLTATGMPAGSGSTIANGGGTSQPPGATGCITYTNDPSGESGPHEGGATGGSSTTVCFNG